MNLKLAICPLALFFMLSCGSGGSGAPGQEGADGQQGMNGQPGMAGPQGPAGPAGMNGRDALGAADKNGTRLRRYTSVLSSDDGMKVTIPGYLYRDTSLSIDCAFQTAADGVQRCLPYSSTGDVMSVSAAATFFSDAGCSQPLYYVGKPCKTPKYLFLTTTSTATCPVTSQTAVYAAPSDVTPTVMYSGSPGACTSLPKSSIDSYLMIFAFYDLTGKTPVSPTSFVGGTTTQMLLP